MPAENHRHPFTEAELERLAAAMGVTGLGRAVHQLTGGDVLFSVEAFRLAAGTDRAADALQVARSLRTSSPSGCATPVPTIEEFLRMAAVAGEHLRPRSRRPGPGRRAGTGRAPRRAGPRRRPAHGQALRPGLCQPRDPRGPLRQHPATGPGQPPSPHRRAGRRPTRDGRRAPRGGGRLAGGFRPGPRPPRGPAPVRQPRRRAAFTAAVSSAERAEDDASLADVLLRRGQVREELGDYAGARYDHQRALALAQGLGDGRVEAWRSNAWAGPRTTAATSRAPST